MTGVIRRDQTRTGLLAFRLAARRPFLCDPASFKTNGVNLTHGFRRTEGCSLSSLAGTQARPTLGSCIAHLPEVCPYSHKSALEDADDLVANLGLGESDSVYEPAPGIDFILGADDHFIGTAIDGDQALRFLNLVHHIIDSHELILHWYASGIEPREFKPNHPSSEMSLTRQKLTPVIFSLL
jgi:hypothetical protein